MNTPNDHDLAARRFQSAARDLNNIVQRIASRYIVQRVPLTWRLLHAIEAEALADLGFASRHDEAMLSLFQRPNGLSYPETDDVVDFGTSNALPPVFAFAVTAYERALESVDPPASTRSPVAGSARRLRAWGD